MGLTQRQGDHHRDALPGLWLAALFARLSLDGQAFESGAAVLLDRSILALLEDGLPHVEFIFDETGAHLIQRDIYTGKTLEIKTQPYWAGSTDPLAMRTADFIALFGLAKSLLFISASPVFAVQGDKNVRALVGGCLYDDIGQLHVAGGK